MIKFIFNCKHYLTYPQNKSIFIFWQITDTQNAKQILGNFIPLCLLINVGFYYQKEHGPLNIMHSLILYNMFRAVRISLHQVE